MKAGDSLIQKSSLPYSANWMTPGSSIPPVDGLTDGREISKVNITTLQSRAFVISEYGGYTCQVKGHTCSGKTYGYKICSSQEEFQAAYHKLMSEEIDPLKEQGLCGAVYTQLSDIEDEINGLITYDREVCKL